MGKNRSMQAALALAALESARVPKVKGRARPWAYDSSVWKKRSPLPRSMRRKRKRVTKGGADG